MINHCAAKSESVIIVHLTCIIYYMVIIHYNNIGTNIENDGMSSAAIVVNIEMKSIILRFSVIVVVTQ